MSPMLVLYHVPASRSIDCGWLRPPRGGYFVEVEGPYGPEALNPEWVWAYVSPSSSLGRWLVEGLISPAEAWRVISAAAAIQAASRLL